MGCWRRSPRAIAVRWRRCMSDTRDGSTTSPRRTVRDPEAAADVVQNTFIKIWGSLQTNPAPEHATAWIYTIARNEAINEVRRSARARPMAEVDDTFIQLDVVPEQRPEDALIDKELAELVWSAAAALNANAYTLLDMHIRQDLSLDEIGAATGASPENVYKNMSRMRESLAEAVADSLLRHDRVECDELEQIVTQFDSSGDLTATERRAISKHVRACEVCRDSRTRVTAPAALFSRLAPIPLAPELAAQMFGEVEDGLDSEATSGGGADSSGGRAFPNGALLVGGAVVLAIAAFLVISSGSETGPVDPEDAISSTHQVGVASESSIIRIEWSSIESDGYSVAWDAIPETLPDESVDWSGNVTRVESPRLTPGTWYFHLRHAVAPSGPRPFIWGRS